MGRECENNGTTLISSEENCSRSEEDLNETVKLDQKALKCLMMSLNSVLTLWDNQHLLYLICTVFTYVTQSLIHKISDYRCSVLSSTVKPFSDLGPDYRGIGIAFAVLSILAVTCGLIWLFFRRNRWHWLGFSSVRYQQGGNEDEIMLPSFHD